MMLKPQCKGPNSFDTFSVSNVIRLQTYHQQPIQNKYKNGKNDIIQLSGPKNMYNDTNDDPDTILKKNSKVASN